MIKQIYINGFPLALDGVRYITSVDGLTAPTIDLATFDRGGRNGIVLGNPYYRGRVFTIDLMILAQSPTMLLAEKDRMLTAVRLSHEGEKYKVVDFSLEDGTTRSVRAIACKFGGNLTPATAHHMTPLTIQMTAEKWYLEGLEHNFELTTPNYGGMSVPMPVDMDMSVGAITQDNQVINAGNTESLPRFHIVGPFNSCDIYNETTGQHTSITSSLSAGETIDLDSFDHTAIKNEVSNVRGSVNGDWIDLVPGGNRMVFAANSTQPGYRVDISYYDAYLGI